MKEHERKIHDERRKIKKSKHFDNTTLMRYGV